MGLHISFKHPFGKHSLLHGAGGIAKKLAPFVSLIPGAGTLAGAALGGLGSLAHGDKFGSILKSGLMGAAGGFAGSKLLGGKGLTGDIFKKLGHLATQPNVLGNASGQLDLGKVLGLGAAGANVIGANAQRRSSQNYANAQTDQRNQLMSRILAGGGQRTYNFAPES